MKKKSEKKVRDSRKGHYDDDKKKEGEKQLCDLDVRGAQTQQAFTMDDVIPQSSAFQYV